MLISHYIIIYIDAGDFENKLLPNYENERLVKVNHLPKLRLH